MVANLVIETAYLFKKKFESVYLSVFYITIYTLKLLIPLIIVLANLKT